MCLMTLSEIGFFSFKFLFFRYCSQIRQRVSKSGLLILATIPETNLNSQLQSISSFVNAGFPSCARLDAIQRVSSQDAGILKSVKQYRREVETRRARLQEARADQARLVRERAAQKASIEGRLAGRQRLLSSVKDEIVQLQAEERQRQAALAAQAQARAQAQQLAAQIQQDTAQATYDESFVTPSYDASVPAARYSHVVPIALQYLGIPYVWGGSSPSTGFDCSGFIMYVFAQIGVSLPHHAASQFAYGTPVSQEQLAAGDLVFFDGLGHACIYIGGGQFVHAPHTGDVVKISSLYDSWYAATWVGGRRL